MPFFSSIFCQSPPQQTKIVNDKNAYVLTMVFFSVVDSMGDWFSIVIHVSPFLLVIYLAIYALLFVHLSFIKKFGCFANSKGYAKSSINEKSKQPYIWRGFFVVRWKKEKKLRNDNYIFFLSFAFEWETVWSFLRVYLIRPTETENKQPNRLDAWNENHCRRPMMHNKKKYK